MSHVPYRYTAVLKHPDDDVMLLWFLYQPDMGGHRGAIIVARLSV